jgi:hypothetical protein
MMSSSTAKIRPSKSPRPPQFGEPGFLAWFESVAQAYTAKAGRTKETAIRTLQREGFLDENGDLAKPYRPQP